MVIGANITQTGFLKMSSPLLEKIQNATVWSQRANTQDIVTVGAQMLALPLPLAPPIIPV